MTAQTFIYYDFIVCQKSSLLCSQSVAEEVDDVRRS